MSAAASASIIYGVRLGRRHEDGVEFRNGPDMLDESRESSELEEELSEFLRGFDVGGATVLVYGSYEDPGHILGFEVQSSGPWECELLEPMVVDPAWDVHIRDLAAQLGVDISNTPIGWHLAAFYG